MNVLCHELCVRLAVGGLVALLGLGGTAHPSSSQEPFYTWTLSSGSLSAEILGNDIQVRLVWRAQGPEGTVQIGALQWPGIEVVGLEVMVDGGSPAPVLEIEPPRALLEAGIPGETRLASTARATERRWSVDVSAGDSLVLLYAVRGPPASAQGRRAVRIPVLLIESEAPASSPDVFSASVRIPDGLSVKGGFPSGFSVERGANGRTVEATLPVLPRTIDLDLTDGELGPLGRTAPLEALALVLIVFAGGWGWRRLTAAG